MFSSFFPHLAASVGGLFFPTRPARRLLGRCPSLDRLPWVLLLQIASPEAAPSPDRHPFLQLGKEKIEGGKGKQWKESGEEQRGIRSC